MKLRERSDRRTKTSQSPPRRAFRNITIEDDKKPRFMSPDLEDIPDEGTISRESYPSRNRKEEILPRHQVRSSNANDFNRQRSQSKSDHSDERSSERAEGVNQLPARFTRGSNSYNVDSKKLSSVRFEGEGQGEPEVVDYRAIVRERRERSRQQQSPSKSRPDVI